MATKKASAGKQFHLNAWINWREWLDVYDLIFNEKEYKQIMSGVEIINMWKSRNCNKLPVAIECTSAMSMVFLSMPNDSGSDEQKSAIDEHNWRRTCSMTIVRFINGMVDQDQKGVYARTVQAVADDLGIPNWLVDLRHEATHSNLPSTDMLKQALTTCLDWIRETYWEPTRKLIIEKETTFQCEFRDLYQDFISSMMRSPKKGLTDLSKSCKTKLGYIIDLIKASMDFPSIHDLAVKQIAVSIYNVCFESENRASSLAGIWSRLVQYLSHFIPNIYRKLMLELCENSTFSSFDNVQKGMEVIWCLMEQNQYTSSKRIANFVLALGLKYVACIPMNVLKLALDSSTINTDLKSQLLSLYTIVNCHDSKSQLSFVDVTHKDEDVFDALKDYESLNNPAMTVTNSFNEKRFTSKSRIVVCDHGASWDQVPIGTIIGSHDNDYKALWITENDRVASEEIWKDCETEMEGINVKSVGQTRIVSEELETDVVMFDDVDKCRFNIVLF